MFWFVAVALAAIAVIFWQFVLPPRSSSRIFPVDPSTTCIDNSFYDDPHFSDAWWDLDGWASALHKMNPVRVAYFDNALKQNTNKTEKQSVLDVGCGGGLTTEGLATLGYNMTGIDISQRSINVAKKHAKDNNFSNVSYVVGSALELPFEDESFDGVVSSDVIEHIHDLPCFVKEIARVIKPGGIFAFDTINRTTKSHIMNIFIAQCALIGLVPKHTHDYRLFTTPDEMRQLLKKEGMSLVKQDGLQAQLNIFKLFTTGYVRETVTGWACTKDLSTSYLAYAVKEK